MCDQAPGPITMDLTGDLFSPILLYCDLLLFLLLFLTRLTLYLEVVISSDLIQHLSVPHSDYIMPIVSTALCSMRHPQYKILIVKINANIDMDVLGVEFPRVPRASGFAPRSGEMTLHRWTVWLCG